MHLDNKSLLMLLSPFIVSGGVWFFSDSLIEKLALFFEPATQQHSSVLEEKGLAYQFFTQHKEEYSSLLEKIKIRHENRFWISERLYQRYTPPSELPSTTQTAPSLQPPPPLIPFSEGDITAPAPLSWSVQMVLPEQETAIINNQIYRVGQSRGGVKLLEVTPSKIYIQTPKGKQWVKLFH